MSAQETHKNNNDEQPESSECVRNNEQPARLEDVRSNEQPSSSEGVCNSWEKPKSPEGFPDRAAPP